MSEHICRHGQRMSAQGGIVQSDIDSCNGDESLLTGLLNFYSACDCCDSLMHHSTCGIGYFVMKDGRTLCCQCASTEAVEDFDGATPIVSGFHCVHPHRNPKVENNT